MNRPLAVTLLALAALWAPPFAVAQTHSPITSERTQYGNYTVVAPFDGWAINFTSEPFQARFIILFQGQPAVGLPDPRVIVEYFPPEGGNLTRWNLPANDEGDGNYTLVFVFPHPGHYHMTFWARVPDLRGVYPAMMNVNAVEGKGGFFPTLPLPPFPLFWALVALGALAPRRRRR